MPTIQTEDRTAWCERCHRDTLQARDIWAPPWYVRWTPRWLGRLLYDRIPCEFQCLECSTYWPSGFKPRHY